MKEWVQSQLQRTHVLDIILNRPDKKNALSRSMYAELTCLLQHANDNPEIRVVLLRGQGGSFSAGNDIADFIAWGGESDAMNAVVDFLHTLAGFRKPLVAAVQGDAVGIGTTVLLHCDLVVAAHDLRCQMPFVKLGLIPEAGSTLLLPQMIGHRQAFELLVEGDVFGAEDALRYGFVNQCVEEKELLQVARKRAERLATLPHNAVQDTKRLLKQAHLHRLHQVIHEETELFREKLLSTEAQQALASVIKKA